MGLADNNSILGTMLKILGVRGMTATTDTPSAKITMEFQQWGKPRRLDLTIQELLDDISQTPQPAQSPPLLDESAGRSPIR